MPDVHIPESLFNEIEKVIPGTKAASPDEFVVEAVRDKLSLEERKREFYRLSDRTRAAMDAQGLTESDLLAEFKSFRARLSG